jgi:hypothetical protein
MTIPDDDTLQRNLLAFLANEPENRADVRRVYKQLALLHPEVTESEKIERYQNSASLWANRVQFARLHLANAGLLYRANAVAGAPRSVWKLTPAGVERGLKLSARSSTPLVPEKLLLATKQDLAGIQAEEEILEGAKSARLVAHYERNPKLRAAAIHHHGATCKACGFNFLAKYGEHGRDYIEVHHLVPLSTMVEPSTINPKTDMTVLCSNCHRMVHRKREKPLSLSELKALVQSTAP